MQTSVTYHKARAEVLSLAKTSPTEKIGVSGSLGRVLSTDIISRYLIPSFNNSAMDGYAARSCDILRASTTLKVVGVVAAGSSRRGKIKKNESVKIMTGAHMPKGSDCVVMVENTTLVGRGRFVKIHRVPAKWENVRFAGEDIKKGNKVLSKGEIITPPIMGVLTSVGKSDVEVFKKVKIGFFTTGDEVVVPPKKLKMGQIYNSNRFSLLGAIYLAGAYPVWLGHFGDKKNNVVAAIREGLKKADIIISSGGVSVGDYDVVNTAVKSIGADLKFEKISIKPGRPTSFAVFKDKIIFALPGNPVSTLISFELFVKPAIFKMHLRNYAHERISACAMFDYQKTDGRRHFLRGVLKVKDGAITVSLTGAQQGSGVLTSLIKSNCLVEIPEGTAKVSKGRAVSVLLPL